MNSELIYNLKEDESGLGWLEGKFKSRSLFQGKIDITIMDNTDVAKEYAEKCIVHYNALNSNEDLLKKIEESLAKFMMFMYEDCEWDETSKKNIKTAIQDFNDGNSLFKYLTKPTLYIELPENIDEIGYVIQTECPWEPEHMCVIIIRENELKYVGPSEGNTPWDDDDEYYCIWNDDVNE